MPKLRLDLDELQVETFAVTRRAERGTGTVRGHAKATYACTEGWDGCAQQTIGFTCDVQCSTQQAGWTCGMWECPEFTEGPQESCAPCYTNATCQDC